MKLPNFKGGTDTWKNTFFAGAIVALLPVALPVSALMASGALKTEISPINILFDGEMFQPKDANGNDVTVFTYKSTTYAPLRALAEAYGLEVGYDSSRIYPALRGC